MPELLISCPEPRGGGAGGLYVLDTQDGHVERILAAHAIALTRWRHRFLCCINHITPVALDRRLNVTNILNPPVSGGLYHDILPLSADELWIVNTARNCISVISEGRHENDIHPLGLEEREPDAAHLNCLDWHEDRIVASAFGRFTKEKEWRTAEPGHGLLVDVRTSEVLLSGLAKPHTPRLAGSFILDSGPGDMVYFTQESIPFQIEERLHLGAGFTRGAAPFGSDWFIGLSGSRYADTDRPASQVCLISDRQVTERWEVPGWEIYDILTL